MSTEHMAPFDETISWSGLLESGSELIAARALEVLASTPGEGDFIANGIWGVDLAAMLGGPERDSIFLMDVRSRRDYEAGHIEDAVHVEFHEWATGENLALLPEDRKIVVVCDFGNTASQVVSGLRLLGYDAAMLRTGMNGWAPNRLSQQALSDIEAADYPVIHTPPEPFTAAPAGAVFDKPSESEFEAALTRARAAMESTPRQGELAFNIIQPDRLHKKLQDPDESEALFLLDLRREEDFEGVGHIDGAIQVDFDAAMVPANLERLPRDRKIVAICYTGNMAAQMAAVLRLLGYDAAVLAYGMVGWKRTPTTYLYMKDLERADNPVVRA